jgi:hypothetical protein
LRSLQSIPRALALAMLGCLLFCVALALNIFPSLRGDFGWRWPYAVPDPLRLLPAIVAVSLYVWGVMRIRPPRRLVLWCFLGAVTIPVVCLFLLGDPLYLLATRTLSGQATGPHLAGAAITDLGATLHDWPQIMKTYLDPAQHIMISGHVALSPPGLPLLYYVLDRAFEAVPALADPLGMALRPFQCQNFGIMGYSNAQLASAWFGILMPVWAGLTVFPLYRLGGRLAAAWWPLVPSMALFASTWNTLYPLMGLLAFGLLASAIQERIGGRSALSIVASGVLISAVSFANISIVPLIGFLGLYTVLVFLQKENVQQQVGHIVAVGLLFGAGLISVWALYYLTSGVTPFALLGQALGQHLGYEHERPYLPWVFLHPYELLMFAGFPVTLLALAGVARSIPALRAFEWRKVDAESVSLAVTLIVLAISGTARGETGRVWLFFVPFILLAAAHQLRSAGPGSIRLVTVTQAVTLITLVGFLRVMDTELKPPPDLPALPNGQASYETLAAPATFDGSVTLVGERAVVHGDGIDLTLAWRADRQAAKPYYLSALIVGPDGQPVGKAINWQPFDTRYPLTCWKPGQLVVETRHLPLDRGVQTGDYWISLSAFDIHDVKGVPVTRPGAAPDTQVGLGPITVAAGN